MLSLLWLIPALPFAGFFILMSQGQRLSRTAIATIGSGSVGLAAFLALLISMHFHAAPPPGHSFDQVLWTWAKIGSFASHIGLYLDPLAIIMILVVTGVGFLIHLYSITYMAGDASYARFFAYMNLFVSSMLILVLADNLLLLYLGWEGVGLCSYLLIGFWYQDPKNGRAAMKAFIVTRIGDTAMALGLFLLIATLGNLAIQDLMRQARETWAMGSTLPIAVSALLLGGAIGKSGQLPLQVWLPDAMAGPTPVSALIHAATMVTAGVYLIARMHTLFELAPLVLSLTGVIGATTLLLAGFSALTQNDIKRVLAYSTISQIGYMFLALGAGAWTAAIFHFMTHAFFKALLFMAAGSIILSLHHEQDMRHMGGLRKQLPVTFWTFLIGAASLASLPLLTAGFYSKDLILLNTWTNHPGNPLFWFAGFVGAFLTGLYTFRMVFLTFFGESRGKEPHSCETIFVIIPLTVLAFLSMTGGFVELPTALANIHLFTHFMAPTFSPIDTGHISFSTEFFLLLITEIASILGVYLAYIFFLKEPQRWNRLLAYPRIGRLYEYWASGWGFDKAYDRIFIQPFISLAHWNKEDVVDSFCSGLANIAVAGHTILSRAQNGLVRWYVMGLAAGAAIILAIAIWL